MSVPSFRLMDQTFRTIRCWLIGAIVCAAALAQLWFWPQNSDLPRLSRSFLEGRTQEFTAGWRRVDGVFATDNTTEDLAVEYPRIAINDEQGAKLAAEMSHRGSYSIYPRRLITAEDGVRIDDGKTILAAQFFPTDAWLKQHNVEAIFTITLDQNRTPQI